MVTVLMLSAILLALLQLNVWYQDETIEWLVVLVTLIILTAMR